MTRRRGLTLVELVVAMAVTTLVMVGVGSAMLVASHALPDKSRPALQLLEASGVVQQIRTELAMAIQVTERSASAVTFTVADRDGDGSPERIRYAWSATPGDPLARQYNGGAEVAVLEHVYELDLHYEVKTATEPYPGPLIESAETELMGYESATSLSEEHVHDNQWWAQYFKPTLPADAVRWKVTRVQSVMKRDHGNDTTTAIQLRLPMTDDRPSEVIVDEATVAQLSLSDSYAWIERSFANASGLLPEAGLCLAFTTTGSNSARLLYQGGDVWLPGAGFVEGKPAWQAPVTDKALLFRVYGTTFTAGPVQKATRQYVLGARLSVRTGNDAGSRFDAAVRMLNAPEVLTAVWEADFDVDPTLTDMNGDGLGDWTVRGGSAIGAGSLVDGVWKASNGHAPLDTSPNHDFAELTTVRVRFRNTGLGGEGAVFSVNADSTSSITAPIVAHLQLQGDDTQTLTVYRKTSSVTLVTLVTVSGLPRDFVDLRLLIDPALDTVNVRVAGVDHGTYYYSTIASAGGGAGDRSATLQPVGSHAEFDHVSVRVGGNNP